MRYLPHLFTGKLTAYQIATATDIDIHVVEDLMDDSSSLEAIDEETFQKLAELEEDLFSPTVKKDETSA